MPDEAAPFTLPIPLQPSSHHALGLHNAPIFQYDLLEYSGENGAPIIVIEPRRADGRSQGPLRWFAMRVLEGVNETYGGNATVLFHDVDDADGDVWLIAREIEVPVIDNTDPAIAATLDKLAKDAAQHGMTAEAALEAAIQTGLIKPTGKRSRSVISQIRPDVATRALTELFSHHVEPHPLAVGSQQMGFTGQAAALDAIQSPDAARRRAASERSARARAASPRAHRHSAPSAAPPTFGGDKGDLAA